MTERRAVSLSVNGRTYAGHAEPRMTLADFLRDELGLTGTHLGCEHGVCGACTVSMDGRTVRSCLLFAVQAEGHELTTVEGLAPPGDALGPIQQAFHETHALQCGFCTPGFLLSTVELLDANPSPTEDDVRAWLSGNLCRCTGYQNIVDAVLLAASRTRAGSGAEGSGGG
ncbi:MAG TPA: (2Fe-2S)-binding protein [Actinomycetota bacterium]|nr:(2Fe-2S)-binding protein [Actinomycetota bacterium]